VGVDVSKDWFDVAVLGEKRTRQFANTKKGIRELVWWMDQLQPELIVVEAAGGYEEALVLALVESGLPVTLVSPQRVRQYARAKGRLAKPDPLDAHLLAKYGQAIQPRLFVGKSEERKQLSALVGRRNQLNAMLRAEKNRLRAQSGAIRSGQKHRDKGITKFGRKELRRALVEAAWQAIRSNPRLRAEYDRLCKRKLPNQAIVAIARKLLVTLWYVLSRQEAYDHFTDEDLAYKMLTWAWHIDKRAHNGLTNQQFAKYGLLQLGRVPGGVAKHCLFSKFSLLWHLKDFERPQLLQNLFLLSQFPFAP
jgi:transposase